MSQPTDPMIHARDDEDLDPPAEDVSEAKPGTILIDDTEVIDASGVSADDVANDDPTPPEETSDAPRRAVDPADEAAADEAPADRPAAGEQG